MSVETHCFINTNTVSSADACRLKAFASSIGSSVEELGYDVTIPPSSNVIIGAGGDGTFRFLAEQAGPEQIVVVFPGGTKNGVAQELSSRSAVVTPEALRCGDLSFLPVISPGEINGKRFYHGAVWDTLGVAGGIVTEQLRQLIPEPFRRGKRLKNLRYYLGAMIAAALYRDVFLSEEHPVSIALLGPNMGDIPVDSRQDFLSDQILLARIKGGKGATIHLFKVFFAALQRKPLPIGSFESFQAPSFDLDSENPVSTVVVDGEIVRLTEPTQAIHIERNRRNGIRAGVLVALPN